MKIWNVFDIRGYFEIAFSEISILDCIQLVLVYLIVWLIFSQGRQLHGYCCCIVVLRPR